MPSARLPPRTGEPENERVQTLAAPTASAFWADHETVVPAPAPLRPASVNGVAALPPAARTTARSNVTVMLFTMLRWALPSFTWTDVTAACSAGSTALGVP